MAANSLEPSVQPRVEALDVLRGAAVLGILFLNIYAFSMPDVWFYYPASATQWGFWDQWVMWFSLTFGAEKFLTLLSVLFGAGVTLFVNRHLPVVELRFQHRRRMMVLAVLGLLHAYGLWFGDILFHYALCGYVLWWLRDLPVRTQAVLAVVLLSVPPLLSLLVYQSVPYWSPEQITEMQSIARPAAEQVQKEIAAYQGGWVEQWPQRSVQAWASHTEVLLGYTLWRTLGLMLVGSALVRLGWLSAEVAHRYRKLCLGALLVGTLLCGYGATQSIWQSSNSVTELLLQPLWNYVGSLLMALGYGWLVITWTNTGRQSGFRLRLQSVGRVALSIYLLQTVFATTLFYGHGFAQFGQWPPVALFVLVIALTGLTLWGAPLWLSHFKQGPMEWLWRRFSYGAVSKAANRVP